MLNSLEHFSGSSERPFDVLDSQRDPGHGSGTTKIKIRFEDMVKPTEILTGSEEALETPQEKPEERLEETPIKITTPTSEKPKGLERFRAPKALISHINRLVLDGRKLRHLSFDIEEASSNEEIRDILNRKFEKALISKEEKDEMLSLLDNLAPETSEEEIFSIPMKVVEEKTDLKESIPEEIVEEIPEEGHPLQIKRKKIENLRNKHGIIVEHAGETHTELESRIVDRSKALWEGNNRDLGVASFLMSGEAKNFEKQPETKPVLEEPVETLQPEVTETEPEKILEVVTEEVKPPELSTEEKLEKIEEKLTEVTTSHEEVFPVQFEGKNVQVVRGENNSVKVLFNEKEIAIGTITKKGPDIKIKKEFKAGILFAPTDEQRAFKKAEELIKTFEIN